MVLLISIEGNIGSGKSTLVSKMREEFKYNKKIYFLDEPVNEWFTIKDEDNVNILSRFYEDTKKYAFSFQMMAYITRISMLRKAIRENPNRIFITERSVFTDKNVFAKMLHEDGLITKMDYEIYTRWFDEFIESLDMKIIYVNTSPSKCYERVIKRNREGETISLDYLEKCGNYHNSWLNQYSDILEFDGNNDKNNSREEYQEWLNNIKVFMLKNSVNVVSL